MTRLTMCAVCLAAAAVCAPGRAEEPSAAPAKPAAAAEEPRRALLSGQVVALREALKRRDIASFEEFDGQFVLETEDGRLLPIVPDWRGRAFFQDERLRNRKVELVARVHSGLPYLQVIMIFTFDEHGTRQLTDYWCDICAIPMYQIKPCDCCQGEIELRYRPHDLPDYLDEPVSLQPRPGGNTPAAARSESAAKAK